MGSSGDSMRPFTRSTLNTPRIPLSASASHPASHAPRLHDDDEFDLRDEVMRCIAKSIGLHQPPLSGAHSAEASPSLGPTSADKFRATPLPSSFGSLSSLMGMGDDISTMTGASSARGATEIQGLDNDVEILYFAAGTTLAHAGERNTGESTAAAYNLRKELTFTTQVYSMSLR